MSIQKILIPTDFSASAEPGVEVALAIAKNLKAEIYFFHFYEEVFELSHVPNVKNPELSPAQQTALAHIHAEMDKLVTRARHAGLNATPIVIRNRSEEKIEEYITARQIDLVIMGTHGVRGFREFVVGSNAQYVLRHSPIPVLVVKQISDQVEFNDILFASRFDEDVRTPLSFILALAEVFKSTIHLLFVSSILLPTGEENAMARIRDLIRQFPETNFSINYSETNDEELAIDQIAREVGADLIALTTHDHQGLLKIFSRSVAEHLANHESLPVLVIPELEH
ncbi:MAG: universal stress protein [Cyclobacteriaceae bacterium]|nr:universal stress protein [Cyclobacteriaceae bacterium]